MRDDLDKLNYREVIDDIEYTCSYNLFRHGVHLSVQYGFYKVKRFISFRNNPIIGITAVINKNFKEMKEEVLEYYDTVYASIDK